MASEKDVNDAVEAAIKDAREEMQEHLDLMKRYAVEYAGCEQTARMYGIKHGCLYADGLKAEAVGYMASLLVALAGKRTLNPSTNTLHASSEALMEVATELTAVAAQLTQEVADELGGAFASPFGPPKDMPRA